MSGKNEPVSAFNYPGGKARQILPLTAMLCDDCNVYVEPFCGSARIALNSRPFEGGKLINDKDDYVANFWKVFCDPVMGKVLLDRLRELPVSKALFNEAKYRREQFGSKRDDRLEMAIDFFILNSQSYNAMGEGWHFVPQANYTQRINQTLPKAFKAVQELQIEVRNEDALGLLARSNYLDDEGTAIYLDPPYIVGDSLRSDSKLYRTEMQDQESHIALMKLIRQAKAKVILSGYWADGGNDLYDQYLLPYGWHRHLLGGYAKSLIFSQDGKEKAVGQEWVWTSYEVPQTAARYLASYCDELRQSDLPAWRRLNARRELSQQLIY